MRVMSYDEAKGWCSSVGPKLTRNGLALHYPRSRKHQFFVEAPEEFRGITYLTRCLLAHKGEADFYGGLLWLRRWDIGSPQAIRIGWRIIESFRQGKGAPQSLEVAPAQLFRDDEFVDLQAFLIQAIGYGWVAHYVPSAGGFFVHFKDNRQVCFTAESADMLKELRAAFSRWNPTDEDPMLLRMKEFERKLRRRAGAGRA
jgi:hypothetical protein